ncbi:phosphatase PAP2 family protein [Blautia sp. CLA-JM-H16]|uniref:Phosphatase PAP2 family protein n=1 Tax=Blautia aquisgranensis TaxID=3133153 RepID=A0ABV1BCC6_9FIRM
MILLIIPKTRKCGAAVLLSYVVSFLIGNEWLKDLITRPRPCAVDDTVTLIVKKPGSFSCPSVHAYLAFSSAMAIFHYYRKAGIGVLVFAALVGFSRMYFFVHYPTDVLFGAALGIYFIKENKEQFYAKEIYDQTADRRLRTALP